MAFFLRFEYADDLIKVLDPSRYTNKIGCPEVLKTRAPKNCNCPNNFTVFSFTFNLGFYQIRSGCKLLLRKVLIKNGKNMV